MDRVTSAANKVPTPLTEKTHTQKKKFYKEAKRNKKKKFKKKKVKIRF